ncbi:MAG: hypothetical protein IPN05_19795 [Sulfuritalea sp.]|nr:hypothetical protein [Sulfuritalea sp.]
MHTLVVAAAVEAARVSKLPPVAPLMLPLTVLLSNTPVVGRGDAHRAAAGAAGDGDDAAAVDGDQASPCARRPGSRCR